MKTTCRRQKWQMQVLMNVVKLMDTSIIWKYSVELKKHVKECRE